MEISKATRLALAQLADGARAAGATLDGVSRAAARARSFTNDETAQGFYAAVIDDVAARQQFFRDVEAACNGLAHDASAWAEASALFAAGAAQVEGEARVLAVGALVEKVAADEVAGDELPVEVVTDDDQGGGDEVH